MKKLCNILSNVDFQLIHGSDAIDIKSIHYHTSDIAKSALFFAIPGVNHNGHNFINKAISLGAIAIVCQEVPTNLDSKVTYLKVSDSSRALAVASSNFYNHPSKKLKLIGVTGTNGKTSTVYLLYNLFTYLNFKVGLISTIENRINNNKLPSQLTTPNAVELNNLLSQMVEAGCQYCFMEVSSHAIQQNRIENLDFDIGVFTNLSRDHLDYHKTFELYRNVKKQFFNNLKLSASAIINLDDEESCGVVDNTLSKKIYYSLEQSADYYAKILQSDLNGLLMKIDDHELSTNLIGDFNAYNILAAYAVACELNQQSNLVIRALSLAKSAPGRFNTLRTNSGLTAIIDYAHSPDALIQIISSISKFCTTKKNLITVIGCGGNRDKGKRSIMGKIVSQYSYKSIFTSDNPRFENPDSIINDMMSDLNDEIKENVHTITNRYDAISFAVKQAKKKSIILVVGKGHEKTQEINGVKTPFDDFKIVSKLLKI
ncbi:MAG: UDP-N-acetylmuramoyl-L-alanyl-D-glutamate--2,6-diaminopimelate ligase [Flavobacteriales bacterium]|nr:UDP-N-acetylmuramoyl-L-alanyl-D-glutamate--2,6-diaminopimelate ligase [Flavobacteriales bacterium]|tara:strand:- start:5734 stop:7188 length:1455 start_codon:yes stop_codon:yes gene_type:complete